MVNFRILNMNSFAMSGGNKSTSTKPRSDEELHVFPLVFPLSIDQAVINQAFIATNTGISDGVGLSMQEASQ